MRNANKGFTLVELLIAMAVMLIVTMGFFGWASTVIQTNLNIEKNNTAYTIATDIGDRLQRMYDNSLIRHNANRKCVGFDGSGNLRECRNMANNPSCDTSSPSWGNIETGSVGLGLTIYTNPWDNINNRLYLYDNNRCEGKMWVDTGCGSGVTITANANAKIDHPNTIGSDAADIYDSISPIRSYKNVTYYAVWSVAYMPCNVGSGTSVDDIPRRKIFVTVYWIDPEPTDNAVSSVVTKINNGTYLVKSVSIVIDKVLGTEQ